MNPAKRIHERQRTDLERDRQQDSNRRELNESVYTHGAMLDEQMAELLGVEKGE